MKRLLTCLLTMVMICVSTVALAQSEEVQLRFSWWGGDERHEATLAAMEAYEASHPGISLVGEYSGFDGYLEKLVTQLAGGTAPDIIQIDYAYLETLWSVQDNFVNFHEQNIVDTPPIPSIKSMASCTEYPSLASTISCAAGNA